MNAPKIFQVLVSLGVPGVALGVFYLLLSSFGFQFETIDSTWAAIIAILFLVVVGGITYRALDRGTQQATQTEKRDAGVNIGDVQGGIHGAAIAGRDVHGNQVQNNNAIGEKVGMTESS